MDLFTTFATDEVKELEGVEVPLGDGTLTIARAENPRFQTRLLELLEENREKLTTLPEKEAKALDRDLLSQAIAETILLGWTKMTYKKKSLKYSVENAKMVLKHGDFKRMVMRHANNFQLFRAEAEEKDEKN